MTLIAVAVVLALILGGLYAIWLQSEEDKAERRKFDRLMAANRESRGWPPPAGPKGFDRNRRKAA